MRRVPIHLKRFYLLENEQTHNSTNAKVREKKVEKKIKKNEKSLKFRVEIF